MSMFYKHMQLHYIMKDRRSLSITWIFLDYIILLAQYTVNTLHTTQSPHIVLDTCAKHSTCLNLPQKFTLQTGSTVTGKKINNFTSIALNDCKKSISFFIIFNTSVKWSCINVNDTNIFLRASSDNCTTSDVVYVYSALFSVISHRTISPWL